MLELATAELLESETNASLRIGVKGRRCRGLVVTAAGCALVVAVEHGVAGAGQHRHAGPPSGPRPAGARGPL